MSGLDSELLDAAQAALDIVAPPTDPPGAAEPSQPAGAPAGLADLVDTFGVNAGGASAAQLRAAFSLTAAAGTGAGIKIGVLSDSFNSLGGAFNDEASGALPPAGNIQILKDWSGSDEGRAMMQIIHAIAPSASLAFYTAFAGEQDFANGILALAAAGCKVICDDVFYFDEPMFQNGIVGKAIEQVVAQGVTFVTAAGNNAGSAYQSAWMPISGTLGGYSFSNAQSFGGSIAQTISVGGAAGRQVPLILEWSQPYGAATTNLQINVFQNGTFITNVGMLQAGNPWTFVRLNSATTYQIVISNVSGANPGLIKEIVTGNGIPVSIQGANAGTVFGHALTPSAIAVAAVNAGSTPAFGVSPAQRESFTSLDTGTQLLFSDAGVAYAAAIPLSPVVQVAGLDNIATTVPGGLSDFYGTSAASASIGAVAALVLAANPNLTPYEVEQILLQSRADASGLVQVDKAVNLASSGGHGVSAIYEGQIVQSTVVASGATQLVLTYASSLNASIQSGGTQLVSGTVSGSIVAAGGTLTVGSGGIASAGTLRGSGTVGAGGIARGTVVSSGGQLILSAGALGSATTVRSGGAEIVGAAAVASGTIVSANATQTVYGSAIGDIIASGGSLLVSSGGTASGTVVLGREDVSFGAKTVSTVVSSGGVGVVSSGGVASATTVSSGGTLRLEQGAIVSGPLTVTAGGRLEVDSGFVLSGFVVSSGAILEVDSGGFASNTTVLSGGTLLLSGGAAAGTVVSSGGTVSGSGTVVGSGQTFTVSSGLITDVSVLAGGTVVVSSGGTVNSAQVSSGGTLVTLGGGTVITGQYAAGATEVLGSGFIGSGLAIGSGVSGVVASAGIGRGVTVAGGGVLIISSGGATTATTIASGGLGIVAAGGVESAATVASGGLEVVFGSVQGGTIASGGAVFVSSGGLVSGTVISASGYEAVLSAGVASAVTVRGREEILSGGIGRGLVIGAGGLGIVSAGGVTTATVVSSGGLDVVAGGAVGSATQIAMGGQELLFGLALGDAVAGELYVYSGGLASGAVISAGAFAAVLNGGIASAGTVLGREEILSGGIARGLSIGAGGVIVVSSGALVSATVVSNGGFSVLVGGAVESGTVLSAGSLDLVYGTAINEIINSGGAAIVSSGGVLSGAILSGGFLEIQSGGTAGSSQVSFTSAGGILQLDDSQHFDGAISGFGVPGTIDLRDIAFATATLGYSGDSTSGILTVQDGARTAQLHLLGQYVVGNFKMQGDGNGGTLITDPPVVDTTSMSWPHGTDR